MATKRKTRYFREGEIIDVEEFHDGRYGAAGRRRNKKQKPTEEQMRKINAANKRRMCRYRLLQYFDSGDIFATWTYQPAERPRNMREALKDFQKAMRRVRNEYKRRGKEIRWIRNIEQGTRGAWHIHIVMNEIGDTAAILQRAWEKGGTYITQIRLNDRFNDADFSKMASYMTKDENSRERKKDGSSAKPRLKEANYGISRNMPLKEPRVRLLKRWIKSPKPKNGYYIAALHEGTNPINGHKYRRYTMIRLRKPHKRE